MSCGILVTLFLKCHNEIKIVRKHLSFCSHPFFSFKEQSKNKNKSDPELKNMANYWKRDYYD